MKIDLEVPCGKLLSLNGLVLNVGPKAIGYLDKYKF